MQSPVFIGDELSATGYRLAGLLVRTPNKDEIRATLQWAIENTSLILLGSTCIDMLPAAELDDLLSTENPPVVVVRDILGNSNMIDLSNKLKEQLGMLE
jgi:hypothetical protein